uniref:Uncharacterized protein n=1 Tax=Romanomermis culicivorax TaxID=13658 RepID=A0A915KZW5_ROMCU
METSNLPHFEDDQTYFVTGNCRQAEILQDDDSSLSVCKMGENLLDGLLNDSSNSSSSLSTRSPVSSDRRIIFENRRFNMTNLEKCFPKILSASTKSDSPPSLNDFDRLLKNTMHLMNDFSRQYVGVDLGDKSSPSESSDVVDNQKSSSEILNFVEEILKTEENKRSYSATGDIHVTNSNIRESNSRNMEAMADVDFKFDSDTQRLEPISVRFYT